jgi:hypothetical protein
MIVIAVNASDMQRRMTSGVAQMFVICPSISFISCEFKFLEFLEGDPLHAIYRAAVYALVNFGGISLVKRSCSAAIQHEERVWREIGTLKEEDSQSENKELSPSDRHAMLTCLQPMQDSSSINTITARVRARQTIDST